MCTVGKYTHGIKSLPFAELSFSRNSPTTINIDPNSMPTYRLDGRKGAVFLGQGPVQGPREEVQGPRARATKRGARASGFSKTLNHACTSNCGPCTELHCLSLVALAHIRGPCTSFCGPCTYPSGPCTHFYLLD